MASTKDEITAIAIEHGYTGKKPDSIAKAIDALADTLAGEDVKSGRSIAGAIHALAPYIGSGEGGSLGALVDVSTDAEDPTFNVATTTFDISGNTFYEVRDAVNWHANVCHMEGHVSLVSPPSGCYVAIYCEVPSDWSPEGVQVSVGETTTSDFECKKLYNGSNRYFGFLTMQIPTEEVVVEFNLGDPI